MSGVSASRAWRRPSWISTSTTLSPRSWRGCGWEGASGTRSLTLEEFWRKHPPQLAGTWRGDAVEADAGHAAFFEPDLKPVASPGEQVRGELVQPRPVADYSDGARVRVILQRERRLLRREGGLEHRRRFGRRPGVELGEYLRRLPRPLIRAAENGIDPWHQPGQPQSRE